jgi:hypothetical protein
VFEAILLGQFWILEWTCSSNKILEGPQKGIVNTTKDLEDGTSKQGPK